MKDTIAWIMLSAKNRTSNKMKELFAEFEKKKHTVNLDGEEARIIYEDIQKAKSMGADIITYRDDIYPDCLRHISHPPAYLYTRGDKSLLSYPLKVTIIGSREASLYGISTASNFAFELANEKIAVVSGGARGIDTAAIKGAMRAGGKVIAVIGTGIDINYPKENAALFNKIAEKGLVVSEFPIGMGPLSQNFPVRNRIMTALGDATVVIEAGAKSGALISASHALEQGKTLFAVPGNIDSPTSAGTNGLLRDGALMATSSGDILFELMERESEKFNEIREADLEEENLQLPPRQPAVEAEGFENLSLLEAAVVNAIKSGKDTYDDILEFCACETNKLTSVLTIMEIKGIIKLAFGNRYKLNK